LKKEKGLSEETIIEMYLDGKLCKDVIGSLELSELTEKYYIDTFRKLYEDTLNERDDNKVKKLSTFAELCNKKIKDKKLDKYDLFLEFLENYKEDGILDLYELGIISLEDSIDIAGQDILDKIFTNPNRMIQPVEIRKLYYKKIISIEKISELINKLPTIEEKYLTIISFFPGVKDEQIRRTLKDNVIKVSATLKGDVENSRISNGQGSNVKWKRIVTDSLYRLQLIQRFDPTCFLRTTSDGHAIIEMPKFKKVVIEKTIDNKGNDGYGASTYIMDKQFYDDNRSQVQKDNKIKRKTLVKAKKENNANKINHDKNWGKKIKEFFLDLKMVRYTPKDLRKIYYTIQRIENSEREVRD